MVRTTTNTVVVAKRVGVQAGAAQKVDRVVQMGVVAVTRAGMVVRAAEMVVAAMEASVVEGTVAVRCSTRDSRGSW